MADPPAKRNILQLIIIFFVVESSIQPTKSEVPPAKKPLEYGSPCSSNAECDTNKNQICSENTGTCDCSDELSSLRYEEETSRCVASVEKSCVFTSDNSPAADNGTVVMYPCERFATCDIDKGNCVPKKSGLFESCISSSYCREDLGLVCASNNCICNFEKAVAVNDVCVGTVNNPCIAHKCASNAVCVAEPVAIGTSYDTVYNPTCKCLQDHFPSRTGGCAKTLGVSCKEKVCKPGLTCGELEYCECLESQIFDETLDTCVAKVNEACNWNTTHDLVPGKHTVCIFGGECVHNEDSNLGNDTAADAYHCECRESFTESAYGTCQLPYGSHCDNQGEQHEGHLPVPEYLACSEYLGLTCVNGKCGCLQKPYAQNHDDSEKRCLRQAGEICTLELEDPSPGPETHNANDRDLEDIRPNSSYSRGNCVQGAICEPFTPGYVDGRCKCVAEKGVDGNCRVTGGKNKYDNKWLIILSIFVGVMGIAIMIFYVHLKRQSRLATNALY